MLKANRFPSKRPTSYEELRPTLQPGDVLICSWTGVFSTMIQRATVWVAIFFNAMTPKLRRNANNGRGICEL